MEESWHATWESFDSTSVLSLLICNRDSLSFPGGSVGKGLALSLLWCKNPDPKHPHAAVTAKYIGIH